jgi:NAD(P)-dependent dehydrogenase (short-subunit alcohol dehydrogenase family)
MLSGKRIVVTGATGSLGKVLVRRLLSGSLADLARLSCFPATKPSSIACDLPINAEKPLPTK